MRTFDIMSLKEPFHSVFIHKIQLGIGRINSCSSEGKGSDYSSVLPPAVAVGTIIDSFRNQMFNNSSTKETTCS
jgi:hypothetical protein